MILGAPGCTQSSTFPAQHGRASAFETFPGQQDRLSALFLTVNQLQEVTCK